MTVSLQQKNKMSKNGKTSKDFFYRATLYVFAILQRPRSRPVSVCPSVRPSVRYVRVLYRDGWRYRQTSFSAR